MEDKENMQVFVRKYNTLKLVATTRPERNLLKFFEGKMLVQSGFSKTTMGGKETEVSLEIRCQGQPGDPSKNEKDPSQS